MDADFWRERWRRGETPWAQSEANGLLLRHWASIPLRTDAWVFVPLCGSSLDMVFLAARGHRILGVELVPEAIEAFFAGQGIAPRRRPHRIGEVFEGGSYRILAGDAFALRPEDLAECSAFYDRAALVAVPPAMRHRYVAEVLGKLPPGRQGLLVSLEFPESARAGPPYPLSAEEIQVLFGDWNPELLERLDLIERDPGFAQGMAHAWTTAWRLRRPG